MTSITREIVDFSGEFSSLPTGLSYRYWSGFVEYVTSSSVIKECADLLTFSKMVDPDRLLLCLYLCPNRLEVWRVLNSALAEKFDAFADAAEVTPVEAHEISVLALDILMDIFRNEELTEFSSRSVGEYIIFEPAYKFWHSVISIGQRLIKKHLQRVNHNYLLARDMFFGYDARNPESLNILALTTYDPLAGISKYVDAPPLCDRSNYHHLLSYLQRTLRVLPSDMRKPIEEVAGQSASLVGLASWQQYAIPPEDTLNWLKMGWQYGASHEELSWPLSSSLYENGHYQQANPLCEHIYESNLTVGARWACAIRMVRYYTEIEVDSAKSESWAAKAQAIVPDGQAYDLLAAQAVNKDPRLALKAAMTALDIDAHPLRESAAMGVFLRAWRRRDHLTTIADWQALVGDMAQRLPSLGDLAAEIRDQFLEAIKNVEIQNRDLQGNIQGLQNLLAEYRKAQEEGSLSPNPVVTLESQIFSVINGFVPQDHDIRRTIFAEVTKRHPEALDSVRETLVDGYCIALLLGADAGISLQDWTAPMVYFAKAVENQAREQLRVVPGFAVERATLGDVQEFLNNNFGSVASFFKIKNRKRLAAYISDLRSFRVKHRNSYVHSQAMQKTALNELVDFMAQSELFTRLNQM